MNQLRRAGNYTIIPGSIKTGTWTDNFAARLAKSRGGRAYKRRSRKKKKTPGEAARPVRLPLTLSRRVAQRREIN